MLKSHCEHSNKNAIFQNCLPLLLQPLGRGGRKRGAGGLGCAFPQSQLLQSASLQPEGLCARPDASSWEGSNPNLAPPGADSWGARDIDQPDRSGLSRKAG